MQTWGGIWISAKNPSDAALQRDHLKLTTLAAITVRRCHKTLALFRWNYSTVHFSVFSLVWSKTVKQHPLVQSNDYLLESGYYIDKYKPHNYEQQICRKKIFPPAVYSACTLHSVQFSIMSYCGPNYILPLVYLNPLDFNAVRLLWAAVHNTVHPQTAHILLYDY